MWYLVACVTMLVVFLTTVWNLCVLKAKPRVCCHVRSLEPDWPPVLLKTWLPLWLVRVRAPSLDQLQVWSEQECSEAFEYYQTNGGFRVHVSNPLDVAAVLNSMSASKPAAEYQKLRLFLGPHGLLTQLRTDDTYTLQRRTISRAFHPDAVRTTMSDTVKRHALALRTMWWKRIAQPNGLACCVSMMPYYDVAECMLTMMCDIAEFGVCPGVSLKDIAAAFRRATANRDDPSPITSMMRSIGLARAVEEASSEPCGLVKAFATSVVRTHVDPNVPRSSTINTNSIMSRIVKSVCTHSPTTTATMEAHAIDHVRTFLFAGFETTTNAVLWAIATLADHRSIQDRLGHELIEAIPDPSHCPDVSQLRALPLLQSVVKEVLRLYPPAPVVYRSVSSPSSKVHGGRNEKQGLLLPYSGVRLPEGTTVAVNLYAMQRNPSVCGDNPRSFDPSRWLGDSTTAEGDVERSSCLPFASGPRSCVGRDIAQIELLVMVATLVRSFVFEPLHRVSDTASLKAFHVTLSPEVHNSPLRVKVSLREDS